MRVVRGYRRQRGASESEPSPKLITSSRRKRYERHENITLQAERFRRRASPGEELGGEHSFVKVRLRRQPLRWLPERARARVAASGRAACSGRGGDGFPKTGEKKAHLISVDCSANAAHSVSVARAR